MLTFIIERNIKAIGLIDLPACVAWEEALLIC